MVTELKPYPEYKDSGVPWLGQVPDNWTVQRLSASITDFVAGTWGGEPNTTDDTICVRVADFDRSRLRVRINRPTIRAIAPADLRRKRLRRGDLLLEKSGGGDLQPVGVVMLFDHEEVAVCSNFVARMSVTTGFEPEFLTYLHTTLYSIGLNVRSIKQTTGIQNLDCRAYLSESVAFPPLSEQVAIVRYLDHADRKVRHAIRARQQLIKLLTEQKQAIIQHAVTRGLDPNVRLKPSGVPWLGDVPDHWEVLPLKRVSRVQGGYAFSSSLFDDHGVPIVRMMNLKSGRLKLAGAPCIPESECMDRFSARAGDLLYGLSGSIGNFGVVRDEDLPVQINQRVGRFVPLLSRISGSYLALVVQTPEFSRQVLDMCTGTAQLNVSPLDVERVVITVPSLPEQTAILGYAHDATAILDKAIDVAHREIDFLREYRTRLIADVVTGKLDVRDVKVPDDETYVLPEEIERIDDVDTVDQTDDVTEGNSESSAEETA